MPEFETERLILRPFRDEDAEDVYRYASDPDIGPAAGWLPHRSVKESLETIRTVLSADETYAVCLKDTGEVIGSIGLFPHRDETVNGEKGMRLPEAGYWIGKPFWGRGLIPEALRTVQKHAFEDLGAEGIYCGYFEGNEKSRRVQEKCGFRYHHSMNEIWYPLFREFRKEHFTYISREMWESGITVRPLSLSEEASALDLAWKVFLKYDAPEYGEEGVTEFRKALDDPAYLCGLMFYGAFVNDRLVSMLAVRENGHICLFFTDEEYQGRGFGKITFERMREDVSSDMDVNSSLYAVRIYERLGFVPEGEEKTVNGIRFIPMVLKHDRLR